MADAETHKKRYCHQSGKIESDSCVGELFRLSRLCSCPKAAEPVEKRVKANNTQNILYFLLRSEFTKVATSQTMPDFWWEQEWMTRQLSVKFISRPRCNDSGALCVGGRERFLMQLNSKRMNEWSLREDNFFGNDFKIYTDLFECLNGNLLKFKLSFQLK